MALDHIKDSDHAELRTSAISEDSTTVHIMHNLLTDEAGNIFNATNPLPSTITFDNGSETLTPVSNANPLPVVINDGLDSLATETTLSAINTKITECDTGNVTIANPDIQVLPGYAYNPADKGNVAIGVVSLTGSAIVSDGDYSPLLLNSDSHLYVTNPNAPSTVTSGDDLGSGYTVFGYDLGTSEVKPIQVDSNGVVKVDIGSATVSVSGDISFGSSVVHVDDNAGSLTVDGTVAATQSGTWNITDISGTVSLPTGAATSAKQPALGTAGTASADVITVQGVASMTPLLATLSGTNNIATVSTVTNLSQLGGTAIAMGTGVRSSGTQRVTIATDDVVPVTQATASNLNAQVVGAVAHDGVDSGNPIKIGGKASTTLPTAVSASADRVDAVFDRHGYQIVRAGNQTVNAWTQVHEPATNTQATCIQAAPGANLKNIVTSITATLGAGATAPTAVQLYVRLVEDAAGTPATIYSAVVCLPATAGASTGVALTNLWIPVTTNKSITLRFSAAGGTNTFESVHMTGTIVAE